METLGRLLIKNSKAKDEGPYLQELMDERNAALWKDYCSFIDVLTNDIKNKGLSSPLKYNMSDVNHYLYKFTEAHYRVVHDCTPIYRATAPFMLWKEKKLWNKMLKEHDLFMYHENSWWTSEICVAPITKWNIFKAWWVTY